MDERTYHRPIGFRVEEIRAVPYMWSIPTETHMTVKQIFSRAKAQEMITFLQNALLNDEDYIAVEITGPSP